MSIAYEITNNQVIFKADEESRNDLHEIYSTEGEGYPDALDYVCEQLHEKWYLTPPESVGALTDSALFSQYRDIDDNGDISYSGILCFYPDYAIKDEWAILADTGEVVFSIASSALN